jgi:hypothetical protein
MQGRLASSVSFSFIVSMWFEVAVPEALIVKIDDDRARQSGKSIKRNGLCSRLS